MRLAARTPGLAMVFVARGSRPPSVAGAPASDEWMAESATDEPTEESAEEAWGSDEGRGGSPGDDED